MSVCAFALISLNADAGKKKPKHTKEEKPAAAASDSKKEEEPAASAKSKKKEKKRERGSYSGSSGSQSSAQTANTEEIEELTEQLETISEHLGEALEKIATLETGLAEAGDQSEVIKELQGEKEKMGKRLEALEKQLEGVTAQVIIDYIDANILTWWDIIFRVIVILLGIFLIRNYLGDRDQKKVNNNHFVYFKKMLSLLARSSHIKKLLEDEKLSSLIEYEDFKE